MIDENKTKHITEVISRFKYIVALVKRYLSEFSEKKNINLIESNNDIILCPQTQNVYLLCNPWWAKIIINLE